MNQTRVEIGVCFQKWPHCLHGDILAASERDMRMPGAKIRLQPGNERGVLHTFMQLKEMRVRFADTDPNYFWPALGRKNSNPGDREKKWSDSNRGERLAEFRLGIGIHIAKKAQGQMHLLSPEPARPT